MDRDHSINRSLVQIGFLLGLLLIFLPWSVSGSLAPALPVDGHFKAASAWGCIGMPVGGKPGIVTIVADQQTSGKLQINADYFVAASDGGVYLLPHSYQLTSSGSSSAVNFGYKGLQTALVDNVIYCFTQNSQAILNLNSFTVSGSGTVNWGPPKSVQYASSGTGMSMFKAVSFSDGIYLISQQKSAGASVLDISQISKDQLEASSGTIIPTQVCQIGTGSGFLAPDSNIYSAMITTYPATNHTVIVGVSDSGGQVYSWYINPKNPSERGQSLLFSTSALNTYFYSKLSSLVLFQGSIPENWGGINDLVVVGFGQQAGFNTQYKGATFTANLTKIGTPGYTWNNANIISNSEIAQWYATPGLCSIYSNFQIPGSGNLRTNLFLYDLLQSDAFGIQSSIPVVGFIKSNILVPDPGPAGTCDTLSSFDTYGNLALPVGFIDGVPPISLNGYELDSGNVDSKVILVQTNTKETESSGSTESSVSAGYNGEFDDGMNGVGASYEQTIKQTTTASTEFSSTMVDTFALDAQGGGDYAYMIYLAPQFKTQRFYVYDLNGNPPASGDSKTIYITYPDPKTPYKYFFQGYNITSPPKAGWLSGALKSPWYNNFADWNFETMSGGWHNRDWSQSPQAGKLFTVYKFEQDIEFQNGGSQTTSYEMTDSLSHTYEVDDKRSADAKILGFGLSKDLTYSQESGITNSIQKGLEFYWSMSLPASGTCGYKTVVIEPQILTPIDGTGAVPWAPTAYKSSQPWFITYNLVEADMISGCPPSTGIQEIIAVVDPRLSGTITMTPSSPKKGQTVNLKANAATGYVFSHWKAWGVDLNDLSSPVVQGIVKSDISTIRADFKKSGSDQISSANFVITPGSATGEVLIRGTIPDALTWPIAMNLKNPLIVTVGGKDFFFGPSVGVRKVLSLQEILFSTPNMEKGSPQLILNFNTKTWTFASKLTENLGRSLLGKSTVRLGISGKKFTAVEELPLSGKETLLWNGGKVSITNDIFSFDKNTKIGANIYYQGINSSYNAFQIYDARLINGTIDPNAPLTLTVNHIKIRFDNATKADNQTYSYIRLGSDLNATIILETRSKTLQVILKGKRLSHITWPESLSIGLQIGTKAAKTVIYPLTNAYLSVQKKGSESHTTLFTQNTPGSLPVTQRSGINSWIAPVGMQGGSSLKNPLISSPSKRSIIYGNPG